MRRDGTRMSLPGPAEIAAGRAQKKELRAARDEERRLARNQRRSMRGRENRKNNKAEARAARELQLAAMSSEDRARFEQVRSTTELP